MTELHKPECHLRYCDKQLFCHVGFDQVGACRGAGGSCCI